MAKRKAPKRRREGGQPGNTNARKAPEEKAPKKRPVMLRFEEADFAQLDRRAELAGMKLGPWLVRECLRLVRDIED